MKLAASNIGWDPKQSSEMLPELTKRGVEGLVIAPTMVWPEAPAVSAKQASEFRSRVEDYGLKVVGMQSLTFGLKEAALSGTSVEQQRLVDHLKRQSELAGHLGAASLIFGSPGLRQEVKHPDDALNVFAAVSHAAADNNTKLCIEPLSGYGNTFVTDAVEGLRFVEDAQERGNAQGVGLHLDAAAVAGKRHYSDYRSETFVAQNSVGIASFDASAPELVPLSADATVPHAEIADALRTVGYEGYISLEMRQPQGGDPFTAFLNEVEYTRNQYGLGYTK